MRQFSSRSNRLCSVLGTNNSEKIKETIRKVIKDKINTIQMAKKQSKNDPFTGIIYSSDSASVSSTYAPVGSMVINGITIDEYSNIIKLNEKLAEENSRLLERVDELNDMVARAIEIKEELLDKVETLEGQIKEYVDLLDEQHKGWNSFYNEVESELTTIKSKWWYKLFRNW